MGKLKEIDKKAEQKGKGLETFWQFIKFIFVSLLAMIVQFALLNILKAIPAIDALRAQDFHWFVFHYLAPKEGLGYFIEFNVANIAAQIVAFFVNREKTFNSGANVAAVAGVTRLPDLRYGLAEGKTSYKISDAVGLEALARIVNGSGGEAANDLSGYTVYLSCDVDMTDVTHDPIGKNASAPFCSHAPACRK